MITTSRSDSTSIFLVTFAVIASFILVTWNASPAVASPCGPFTLSLQQVMQLPPHLRDPRIEAMARWGYQDCLEREQKRAASLAEERRKTAAAAAAAAAAANSAGASSAEAKQSQNLGQQAAAAAAAAHGSAQAAHAAAQAAYDAALSTYNVYLSAYEEYPHQSTWQPLNSKYLELVSMHSRLEPLYQLAMQEWERANQAAEAARAAEAAWAASESQKLAAEAESARLQTEMDRLAEEAKRTEKELLDQHLSLSQVGMTDIRVSGQGAFTLSSNKSKAGRVDILVTAPRANMNLSLLVRRQGQRVEIIRFRTHGDKSHRLSLNKQYRNATLELASGKKIVARLAK